MPPKKLNIIYPKKKLPKKLNIIEPKKKPVKKPAKKLPTKLRIVKKKIEPKKKPVKKKKMPTKLNIVKSKPKAKARPKKLNILPNKKVQAIVTPKVESHPEMTAITGLTQSEANAMNPMALFGMLPLELARMVMTPSLRGGGVKVGETPVNKFTLDDAEAATNNVPFHDSETEFSQNMGESMHWNGDFTEYAGYRVLTKRENTFYRNNLDVYRTGGVDDMPEKSFHRMEDIETKIMEKSGFIYHNVMNDALKRFKKENKGKTYSPKQFDMDFAEYFENF